ncbi:MAG: hypothetical protein [Bacteriophage sp.]|nr:MAG: hypothetical protein [Bacteriophage sp.]
MPHIITGEIRKEPFTKEGNGNNGPWKMYAIDLSERYKDKDGNPQYTNYRATFFSNEKTRDWYDEAFQLGRVVSVSCEVLAINQREGNDGKIYISLEPQRPNLVFSQRGESSGGNGQQRQQQQNSRPQQQPQQQQSAPQQPRQQQNNATRDFDDDIPF